MADGCAPKTTKTCDVTKTKTVDVTNTKTVEMTDHQTAAVTKTNTVDVTVTHIAETCAPTTHPAPPPTHPTTTMQPTTTKPQPTSSSCPTDLSGNYEFPHLMVPIDSSHPNKAAGTSYFGTVSDTVSTIFDFDIPAKDSGKTCSLIFLFPKQSDLQTSSYTFKGDGKIDVAKLKSPATDKTTYDNAPGVAQDYGTTTIAPGSSYLIATFDCPANQRIGFEVSNAGSTDLHYFQDYNPSPWVSSPIRLAID